MKRGMKGHQFDKIGEVKKKMRKELSVIFKDDFKKCFKQWKHWWDK